MVAFSNHEEDSYHEDSQFKLGSTVYPVNKVAGMPSIQFWHTKMIVVKFWISQYGQ